MILSASVQDLIVSHLDNCKPWVGGSVGGSIVLYSKKVAGSSPDQGTDLGGRFGSWSGHLREATV